MVDFINDDNNRRQVELEIVTPSDISEQTIPNITDLFAPQELRAEALQGSDYLDTPIYVHDFEIIDVNIDNKNVPMVVMSVVIPEANEYGTMNVTAWGVVKVFKGIASMGSWTPCFIEFIEVPSAKGNSSYRIKTQDDN